VEVWLQDLLGEERDSALGCEECERKETPGPGGGYRNGYGKPRQLATTFGTVTVRRPRVRGLEERFESAVLPLFAWRTKEIGELLPELYLHGLAEGDFDKALRGLLGDAAPLSGSSIARLNAKWQVEYEAWKQRRLDDLDVVYVWVDGVYVKAGLEKEKAALLVVVAALRDGSKVVLAIESGYRESTESWLKVLRDLKARGMNAPRLAVGDGALGFWGALAAVYPSTAEQRCWSHRICNVLDQLSRKAQANAKMLLTPMPYTATREAAERCRKAFQDWCEKRGYGKAGALLDEDWERMVTFYQFPEAHWKHLRTTNPVESPFAATRLRTNAAKRYKKVANVTAVIWKTLLLAEQSFRKLNAPELCAEVAEGTTYENGVRVRRQRPEEGLLRIAA
jgi:transposase-like protein